MILNLVSLHKPLYIMGTKEKLIERFLTLPKNFTYDEVKRLFGLFGYNADLQPRRTIPRRAERTAGLRGGKRSRL